MAVVCVRECVAFGGGKKVMLTSARSSGTRGLTLGFMGARMVVWW